MTLRYAFRSLAKSKGFVTIAVIALGVGLGMSTTMFAVMDAVIHPYQAYRDPETLFSVSMWAPRQRNPLSRGDLYRFLRENSRTFASDMVAREWSGANLIAAGGEERIGVSRVTPAYFGITGLEVENGRTFRRGDGEDVAIVSRGIWRRLYGKRKELAGATVTLTPPAGDFGTDFRSPQGTFAIIGVLPEGWSGSSVILPMSRDVETGSVGNAYVTPLVRLRAGVTRARADSLLDLLGARLTAQHESGREPFAFDLVPMQEQREEIRDIQKAMIGAALAVLLIACVNLAHLMLARGLAKRRELALRMALGATRGIVVRQMFLECVIITLAGAALGAVITVWGADFLRNRMPPEVRWVGLVKPMLSWRVFAASTAAAALSAILFGLLPAIRVAMMLDVQDPLKDDSGTTTGRVRQRYSPLVISEVALALVLLMGGGLMLRTLYLLQKEDEGVNAQTLYRINAYAAGVGRGDAANSRQVRQDVMATLLATDGVRGVATDLNGQGTATGEMGSDSTRVINWDARGGLHRVSPDYLKVVGLPMLKGRNFEPGDAAGAGVVIIDPLAAQRLYPRIDPVGRMLKLGGPMGHGPWLRIIGVARSPRMLENSNRDAPQPTVWVVDSTSSVGWLVVRTATSDRRMAALLQTRVMSVAGVRGAWVMPWDWERQAELVSRGFLAKVFVTMGAVALGLSALGLYGVLAYAVNRRMREFAVRMALGAQPRLLMNMVFHDGAVMILAGTGVGAFGALLASRYLDSVLVSVLPSDVISLVLAEALLMATGFAAAFAPARRASRADPLDIIRAV